MAQIIRSISFDPDIMKRWVQSHKGAKPAMKKSCCTFDTIIGTTPIEVYAADLIETVLKFAEVMRTEGSK